MVPLKPVASVMLLLLSNAMFCPWGSTEKPSWKFLEGCDRLPLPQDYLLHGKPPVFLLHCLPFLLEETETVENVLMFLNGSALGCSSFGKFCIVCPAQVLAQNLKKRTEGGPGCIKIQWIPIIVLSLLCVPFATMLLSILYPPLMYFELCFSGLSDFIMNNKDDGFSWGGWGESSNGKL